MSGGPCRIVAIDCDVAFGQQLLTAFWSPEYDFHWFADGREALGKLQEIRPDVIVSELMLPGLDGRALLDTIRLWPELRAVPFLVLSSVRSGPIIRAMLQAGATAFLVKPCPMPRLKQAIHDVLATAPRRRHLDGGEAPPRAHEAAGQGNSAALVRPAEGPTQLEEVTFEARQPTQVERALYGFQLEPVDRSRSTPSGARSRLSFVRIGALAALVALMAMFDSPPRKSRRARPPAAQPAGVTQPQNVDQVVQGRLQWAQALLDHGHFDDARAVLREVLELAPSNAQARQLGSQLEQSPTGARPGVTTGVPEQEHRAVLALLERYQAALEQLDVAGLTAIWPSADAQDLSGQWKGFQSRELALRLVGLEVKGDAAVARCVSYDDVLTTEGERIEKNSRTTFQLRRDKSSWLIDAVNSSDAPPVS